MAKHYLVLRTALLGALLFCGVAFGQTYNTVTITGGGSLKGDGANTLSSAASSDISALWSGTCNASSFLRGDGTCAAPTGITCANPTGTIGLTAVNGVSTNCLRSDGAPALSQAIVPTWTGIHTWSLAEVRQLFSETGLGANLGLWDSDLDAGVFKRRTRTDADGAGQTYETVTRGTTTNVASVQWNTSGGFGPAQLKLDSFASLYLTSTYTGGDLSFDVKNDGNVAGATASLDLFAGAGVSTVNGVYTSFGALDSMQALFGPPAPATGGVSFYTSATSPTNATLMFAPGGIPGLIMLGDNSLSTFYTPLTTTGIFTATLAEPRALFNVTGGGTNGKLWDQDFTATLASMRTRTDADAVGRTWLAVTRTAASVAITNISFGDATGNPSYNFLGTSNASFGGTGDGSSAGVVVNSTSPRFGLRNTSSGTDNKVWSFGASLTGFFISTRNDANATGKTGFALARSGTTITDVSVGNAVDNPTFSALGTGLATFSGGVSTAGARISAGTKFVASGCSNSTTVGGSTAGQFASGTTGACTVTITLPTAPNGWNCAASDITTPSNLISQSGVSTTSCTITGTTVSGDTITFQAMGY